MILYLPVSAKNPLRISSRVDMQSFIDLRPIMKEGQSARGNLREGNRRGAIGRGTIGRGAIGRGAIGEKGQLARGANGEGTVVRHSSEKGAIIILANFFFNLNSHFNLYNDVFEGKNDFEGQMGKLVF
jgi:hypothetical protein